MGKNRKKNKKRKSPQDRAALADLENSQEQGNVEEVEGNGMKEAGREERISNKEPEEETEEEQAEEVVGDESKEEEPQGKVTGNGAESERETGHELESHTGQAAGDMSSEIRETEEVLEGSKSGKEFGVSKQNPSFETDLVAPMSEKASPVSAKSDVDLVLPQEEKAGEVQGEEKAKNQRSEEISKVDELNVPHENASVLDVPQDIHEVSLKTGFSDGYDQSQAIGESDVADVINDSASAKDVPTIVLGSTHEDGSVSSSVNGQDQVDGEGQEKVANTGQENAKAAQNKSNNIYQDESDKSDRSQANLNEVDDIVQNSKTLIGTSSEKETISEKSITGTLNEHFEEQKQTCTARPDKVSEGTEKESEQENNILENLNKKVERNSELEITGDKTEEVILSTDDALPELSKLQSEDKREEKNTEIGEEITTSETGISSVKFPDEVQSTSLKSHYTGLEGPFELQTLIPSISFFNSEIPESADSKVSYIAGYENNIYVGTQHGEILHYHQLESEYVLISRQKVHATKKKPVNKILILTGISRALILSGSMLNVFTLPELSPANIGKIKDVSDLTIDLDSNQQGLQEIPVVLFTKKMIRFISVSHNNLKLVKDINYPNTIKGLQRSRFSLVATATNYDLIDIDSFQKIPLVPVCSLPPEQIEIQPLILPVLDAEYLVTCGLAPLEPAMGMIVNTNGDISRGTIAWKVYPDSVGIAFPYCLAAYDPTGKRQLFELVANSIVSQETVQTFEFANPVALFEVLKQFTKHHENLKTKLVKVNYQGQVTGVVDEELYTSKSLLLLVDPASGQVSIVHKRPVLSALEKPINHLEARDKLVQSILHGEQVSSGVRMLYEYLTWHLACSLILEGKFSKASKYWLFSDSLLSKLFDIDLLSLRLSVNYVMYLLSEVTELESFGRDTLFKTVYETSVEIIKKARANGEFKAGLIKFCLAILEDWLDRLKEFINPKSQSLEVPIAKSQRRRSFDTGQSDLKIDAVKVSRSDTNLTNLKFSTIASQHLSKQLALVPKKWITTFKAVELLLLDYYLGHLSDSQLLQWISTRVSLSINETIDVLKRKQKYFCVLQLYQCLNMKQEYLEQWMSLVEGKTKDGAFNEQASFEVIIQDIRDPLDFSQWLIDHGKTDLFKQILFNKRFLKTGPLKFVLMVKSLNKQLLMLTYLEYLVNHGNKTFFGELVLQDCAYVCDHGQNPSVIDDLNSSVDQYKSMTTFPKLSIKSYFKAQMKFKTGDPEAKTYVDIFNRFQASLHLIEVEDTLELLENQSLKPCSGKQLLNAVHSKLMSVPGNAMVVSLVTIEAKLEMPDRVIEHLMKVADFSSVEKYITSGGSAVFDSPTKALPFSPDFIRIKMADLYKNYLQHESQSSSLIQNFLKNYNNYIDFEDIITTIPDTNTLEGVTGELLLANFVRVNNKYTDTLMKKNLARSQLKLYETLYSQILLKSQSDGSGKPSDHALP